MKLSYSGCKQTIALAVAAISLCTPAKIFAQTRPAKAPLPHPSAVLIELFTSEGCSDCPPADELLRQVSGRQTEDGQLIVGISEHVTYWNRLGWRDPFSADQYTERQNAYGTHFGLDSVYTPQMVVNGREEFVGSDRRALVAALASEAQRKQIELHITSAQIAEKNITFSYSAMGLPANGSLQLVAVMVDDVDRSNVSRGENSGRELIHASVARAIAPLGALHETEQQSVSLPLPPSFTANPSVGHYLVLFAQQDELGAVLGIDSKRI
jgi:hypothetical protein